VGIAKYPTKLVFILWPLCKYFIVNFMFLKFFEYNIEICFKLVFLG
jgi:hypothetical protein